MSNPQPETPNPAPWGCLLALGIILLFPGLCSLVFAFLFGGDFFGAPVWPPPPELILFFLGLLIAALGVAFVTWAIRKALRS
jgi:hypothetical protein